VRVLIELGADIKAQGGLFGNALQAAASRGHDSVVRVLIELGPDIEPLWQRTPSGGFLGP